MVQKMQTFAVPFAVFWLLLATSTCGGKVETVAEISSTSDATYVDKSILYEDREMEGKATASIEERIFAADVVVKARFLRAGEDILHFRAIEYKKGGGPKRFTVKAETESRDTQWDNEDAVLFLNTSTGASEDFKFIDSTTIDYSGFRTDYATSYTGDLPEGYWLGTRNPVWLPVSGSGVSTSSLTLGRSASSSGEGWILSEYDRVGVSKYISESKLGQTISWIDGPTTSGSGLNGRLTRSTSDNSNPVDSLLYDTCIQKSLYIIRIWRDDEAHYGEPIEKSAVFPHQIESGAGRGTYKFIDWEGRTDASDGPNQYGRYIVYGHDAELFKSRIHDGDLLSLNGYDVDVIARRPLPAGEYGFKFTTQGFPLQACDFKNDRFMIIDVESIAPPGTVHEAFFDPATTTAGVGYLAGSATTTGVLEPAGFSFGGRDVNITGLTWHNGQVVLELDRFLQLSESLSFIEPDGTAGLYLSQYDATEDWAARTLTWQVAVQPWEPGDELMLSMGPIPLPGVRNLTGAVNSEGQVVLSWEVDYSAGVSGFKIWRHHPAWDDGPKLYISNTLSTATTFTDQNTLLQFETVYSVQAIDRVYNAGERSESVRIGGQ